MLFSETWLNNNKLHCIKSVRIRSFSGPYFRAFGLNTEIYFVDLRFQTECGNIRPETSNTDTFHALFSPIILSPANCHTCNSCTFLICGNLFNNLSFSSVICIWCGTEFIKIFAVSVSSGIEVLRMIQTIISDMVGST